MPIYIVNEKIQVHRSGKYDNEEIIAIKEETIKELEELKTGYGENRKKNIQDDRWSL